MTLARWELLGVTGVVLDRGQLLLLLRWWRRDGHGCLSDWPDRLLSRLLLHDLSLIKFLRRFIYLFVSVSALISLDLHDLLLYLVKAHQFMELVCDLVEDLQLILEQARLLQMADEVHRRWNNMLWVLFWHSASINIKRFLVGTVLHELLASRLVLLVALGWGGSTSSLVQGRVRPNRVLHLFLVLLLKVVLDVGVCLR